MNSGFPAVLLLRCLSCKRGRVGCYIGSVQCGGLRFGCRTVLEPPLTQLCKATLEARQRGVLIQVAQVPYVGWRCFVPERLRREGVPFPTIGTDANRSIHALQHLLMLLSKTSQLRAERLAVINAPAKRIECLHPLFLERGGAVGSQALWRQGQKARGLVCIPYLRIVTVGRLAFLERRHQQCGVGELERAQLLFAVDTQVAPYCYHPVQKRRLRMG